MIKWLVKRCLLRLLAEDEQVQMKVTETANPQLAWDIKYGELKHPPPPWGKNQGWWRNQFRKS